MIFKRHALAVVIAALATLPQHGIARWTSKVQASESMPEKVELLLNGRPLVDGRLGVDYTGIAEPADSFIVAGTNVLVMRVAEIPEPGSPEAQIDPRSRSYASFSLGISGPSATEWVPTQSFGKNSKEFPIEYTFVVTNAWPVKRLPWQLPAPEFTEKDREEILAILRGIAKSCGNLKTEGGKETLYNTLRMDYELRARLEGVAPEEMKRRVFAIYDRMAPFCMPSVSTFSSWETTPVAGANLVIAKPRKGDRDMHAPDGSYAGNDAALISTKTSSTAISLPNNFSKINGKWQVAPGNYNNEWRFTEFEKRRGPLELPDPPPPPEPEVPILWEWSPSGERLRPAPAFKPASKRYVNSDPPDTSPNAMGYGAPGKILPYKVDAKLAPDLKKYNLTAHWFVRDPFPPDTQSAYFTRQDSDEHSPTNALSFLLFTPKNRGAQKMPIVMFVPGNGEVGTDLSLQFRQRTIFEVATSDEFQRKRPCYLFVPMPPDGRMLRGASPTRLSDHGHLMNDALMNVIATRKSPAVDTERVYLTGLSFGATGAYSFGFVIPDRFAAVVPVSSYGSTNYLHPTRATSFWHFNNEKKASLSPRHDWLMESMKAGIEERGGEFKASTFPDSGHNAWDKAWREEAVWEWMFSKRSKTWDLQWSRPGSMGHPLPEKSEDAAALAVETMEKDADRNARAPTVSAPSALNSDHSVDRMLDGLLATWYATTNAVSREEWIQIEYPQPARGNFTITSGTPDSGAGRIQRDNVETSADGVNWTRQANFKNDGICAFKQADPIRFLRIAHSSPAPQTIAIREVKREDF